MCSIVLKRLTRQNVIDIVVADQGKKEKKKKDSFLLLRREVIRDECLPSTQS